jgi:AcrR family transcriptional regulator
MQRRRILDAMVCEVGEWGLRGVTIAGVSARAGVSRSTFYELFKDLDTCVLAGSPEVLEHRARELAALNPLVDVGREQVRTNNAEPVELTAEASVASVAGILHTRLVTGRSSACSANSWASSSARTSTRMRSSWRSSGARRWRKRSPRSVHRVPHPLLQPCSYRPL